MKTFVAFQARIGLYPVLSDWRDCHILLAPWSPSLQGAALFPATSPCGRPCAEGFHVAGGDPAPICCGAAVRCSLFGRFLPKLGRPSGRPFSSMWVSARRQRGAAHRRPPIGKGRHDYPGFNEARGSPASSWNDFRLSAHESLLSWWSQGEAPTG
jgi:hypothetical protein